MRRLIIAVGLIALVSDAFAADMGEYSTLRGSNYVPGTPSYIRWSGAYVGGQIGYQTARMDFANTSGVPGLFGAFDPANPATAPLSVAWARFGTNNSSAISYGAFLGYNTQWDDLVLGAEVNFNFSSLTGMARDQQHYNPVPTNQYNVDVTATNTLHIRDYTNFRLRAGYVYDNFLPYATVGLAVGRAQFSHIATATGTPTAAGIAAGAGPFAVSEGETGTQVAWGYSGGLGIDYAIRSNIFLRGEYEYIKFLPLSSTLAAINAFRVGAGFRF